MLSTKLPFFIPTVTKNVCMLGQMLDKENTFLLDFGGAELIAE